MGESKRRRALFAQALSEMLEAGQGVWELQIVPQAAALELMAEALAGNPRALALAETFSKFLEALPLERPPTLCLLCDHAFTRGGEAPGTLVMLRASTSTPAAAPASVSGVCRRCTALPDLQGRVVGKLRSSLIGDLRVLPPAAAGGRA